MLLLHELWVCDPKGNPTCVEVCRDMLKIMLQLSSRLSFNRLQT